MIIRTLARVGRPAFDLGSPGGANIFFLDIQAREQFGSEPRSLVRIELKRLFEESSSGGRHQKSVARRLVAEKVC
ncbi:MAG: hypothetical protein QOJ98_2938 [Acidobacteriota bacterium]|nr:hypothetical protein [Acidobacteriota bacterium]